MAVSSSSLVVKISADITDFSRQLDNATRVVDKAAKKVESLGTSLTVGITLPVFAATAALAKMASENEDIGARFERVLGGMASATQATIGQIMKVVPETNTELQKMAISVDNMAQGLGLGPTQAAKMSESILKLAADASAFAHVPMADALDALSRGLAGKTKGLLEFGIAISQADIKQRAFEMGLLHQGNELTETGTALAAYSLIMERSSRIHDEAARTADQMGKSFEFLKRDVSELADNVSHLVLPALSELAKDARDVVAVFAGLDPQTVKTFFQIAAGAAVIGPMILALVKLVDAGMKVKTAFALLAAGETGVGGVIAAMAAVPFAVVVGGVLAIAAAIAALYVEYQKLKDATSTRNTVANVLGWVTTAVTGSELVGNSAARLLRGGNHSTNNPPIVSFHNAPVLSPSDLASLGVGSQGNGPTERSPITDPLKLMEESAKRLTDAFKHMGDGWQIPNLTADWVLLLAKAQAQYDGIKDKTSDIASRLRDIISSLTTAGQTAITRQAQIDDLSKLSPSNLGVQATKQFGTTALAIDGPKIAEVGQAFSTSALAAASALNAQDQAAFSTELQYQQLRQTLELFGISIGEAGAKAQVGINIATGAAINFAQQLVANAGGSGKGAGIGRALGGLGGAIAGALFGPGTSAAAAIIGSSIGGVIGTGIGGLFGGLFDGPTKASNAASSSLNTLATTVDKVTASITNLPPFFKLQSYQFEAAPVFSAPVAPPTPTPYTPTPQPSPLPTPLDPTAGGTPSGNRVGGHTFNIQSVTVQASDVKSFLRELETAVLKKAGTGSASRFAFAGNIK